MNIINEKKYPYLKNLSDGIIKKAGFTADNNEQLNYEEIRKMYKCWKENKFGEEEILIITKPFNKAVQDSINKLYPVVLEEINNTNDDLIGTMLVNNIWISYKISFRKDSEDFERELYILNEQGLFIAYLIYTKELQIYRIDTNTHFTEAIQVIKWFDSFISTIIAHLIFRKYAEVETKIVFPTNRKPKEGEYFNKTKCIFTVLDSKWFTNLVRSEGFKVRGHFRLQPCKNENKEWIKKLIWIEDFEKRGYSHKAKITEFVKNTNEPNNK